MSIKAAVEAKLSDSELDVQGSNLRPWPQVATKLLQRSSAGQRRDRAHTNQLQAWLKTDVAEDPYHNIAKVGTLNGSSSRDGGGEKQRSGGDSCPVHSMKACNGSAEGCV